MQKVKNRKVITRLSLRSLKSNRKKNVVIIIAIMLTCILFTSLFSIGVSMMKSMQNSTMRQVGGESMAGIKYILPKDYEKLKKDKAVKNPTYRISIGSAKNSKLLKLSTEINFAEDKDAKDMFCYPTNGTMPKERLELATSTLVLDALGIEHRLGETVTLEFNVKGKEIRENYTLCGYWEGDPVAQAQQCFLSRTYCDEVAPTPTTPFYNTDMTDYTGYWMMDLDYSNSWNIEDKTVSLLIRNGYDINKQLFGVNWAYTMSTVDLQAVVLILVLLFMILVSGYLIIYNVFYINVSADIYQYGLLKTIGTTRKQLKRMVRQQAMLLSVIGIPVGLVFGTMLSRFLLPVIMGNYEIGKMQFSINPVIYILSTIFTFVTVWISSRKPCELAGKVSPVEAIRYTEKKVLKKKQKKSSRISAFSMARDNISRARKKLIIVVLSLSLSMIIMNSVYSVVQGLDVDKYVSESIIGDFAITDASVLNFSILERNFAGVSKEARAVLSKIKGVESISNIYCNESLAINMDDKCYEKVKQFAQKHSELLKDKHDKQNFDRILENKTIDSTIYGLDEWAFSKLSVFEGNLDWDKFVSGNYIVVYTYEVMLNEKEAPDAYFYRVGDKVSLKMPDGATKEYEVMAIADVPYAMSKKSFSMLGANVVLPEQEYLKNIKDIGALYSILNVKNNKINYVDQCVKKYTTVEDTNLTYVSKQSYAGEFDDYIRMFFIVGGALSILLALIGILNFMNAMATSLIARRQEFAMLQAVGMTGKQLKAMLMYEGAIYACLTVAFSATFGSLIGYGIVKAVAGQIWFFSYHFTIVPILFCIPVLILLSCLIPYVSYRVICKASIVDRLKITQ